MATKELHDDPVESALLGLLTILMRRSDAEGRKQIYEDLYTMHVASGKAGQPRSSKMFRDLAHWAAIQRQQLDPH